MGFRDHALTSDRNLSELRVPDADYVRGELPISDVAVKLGLQVKGRHVRCPNDLSHWAQIWVRKNAVKCFQCRRPPWSTIDLVMQMRGLDVGAALRWIGERFDVPQRRVRVTTNRWGTTRHRFVDYPSLKRPTRLEPGVGALRRSLGWPKVSHGARQLALFFVEVIPRDTLVLATTYRKLQRDVGIGNRRTVRRALTQLEEIGLICADVEASSHDMRGRFANQTVIRLTWGSGMLQDWLTGRVPATKYSVAQVNLVKQPNRQESEPGTAASSAPGSRYVLRADLHGFSELEQVLTQSASKGSGLSGIVDVPADSARAADAV